MDIRNYVLRKSDNSWTRFRRMKLNGTVNYMKELLTFNDAEAVSDYPEIFFGYS